MKSKKTEVISRAWFMVMSDLLSEPQNYHLTLKLKLAILIT